MASREVFHFDEFALDVGERRMLRGTETVRLSPKAYDVMPSPTGVLHGGHDFHEAIVIAMRRLFAFFQIGRGDASRR